MTNEDPRSWQEIEAGRDVYAAGHDVIHIHHHYGNQGEAPRLRAPGSVPADEDKPVSEDRVELQPGGSAPPHASPPTRRGKRLTLLAVGGVVCVALLAFLLVDVLQPAADTKANNASKLTRGKGAGPATPTTHPIIQVAANIPVGKGAYGVAVDPSAHTAYVTNEYDGSVSVIDAATNTVTATLIGVGDGPVSVAIGPAGGTAYVTNFVSNTVSVLSTG